MPGISDQEGIFAVHRLGGTDGRGVFGPFRPVAISIGIPGDFASKTSHDQHCFQAWTQVRSLIGHFLQGNRGAAFQAKSIPAVSRAAGFRVIQPRRHGRGPKAGKDGQGDRTNLGNGKEGDHDLRNHRQKKTNAIASAHTEGFQGIGRAIGHGEKLSIRSTRRRRANASPSQRKSDLIAAVRNRMPIHTVIGKVQRPSHKPACPGNAIRNIENAVVGLEEIDRQIPGDSIPEPFDVFHRTDAEVPRHSEGQAGG